MAREQFDLSSFIRLAQRIGSDAAEVEVKAAANGLPKDIVKTLSAFANKSGGTVICGLSEQDGFVPATGFDAKRISASLAQACSDKMEPPVRADIRIEDFKGSLVVIAAIPETAPYLKPCYIKARGPYDGSFVRTGEGDRHLSRYEVDRLMEERQQPRFDAGIVEEATLEDFDQELVQGFLRRERAVSPRVFAGLSDQDSLLSMGVTKRDGSGSTRPTLAGLMALGRHPQQYFPRANVTFAVFPGTSKEALAEDGARFLDSRTIIGPVPVMIAETLACVRRNMNIASYVDGGARHDVPDYPEVAVREAVANALMHRDYSPEGLGSQVQVNMYADRLEVINPGGLYGMVTVDNIGEYGASSARNQFLSRILESTPYPEGYPERGYVVENKGTGFAQMQAALKARQLPPPEPIDSLSVFVLRMRKRAYREGNGVLQLDYRPPASAQVSLTVDGERIVEAVRQQGSISTGEVSDLLGVSPATALRRLKVLVSDGILSPTGHHGRSTRYVLM